MRTMIAIPCMDNVPYEFASTLLELWKPNGTQACFKPNSLIYDSRNLLSLTASEHGFERILWLDSDVIVPADTLTKLSEHLDNGYDLVTGLYFRRTLPTKPVIFDKVEPPKPGDDGKLTQAAETYLDYPKDSLFDIEGCGFGCVMTTVDLIKRVWDKFGPAFTPYPWASEDVSFCYRAKLLGAKMACDSTIKVGHVGTITYTEEMYERK